MTLTIEIPDELATRASAAGLATRDLSRFAVAGAYAGVDALIVPSSQSIAGRKPTPSELLVKLKADGVLSGFGDPGIDSPELARQIRERFSVRTADSE